LSSSLKKTGAADVYLATFYTSPVCWGKNNITFKYAVTAILAV